MQELAYQVRGLLGHKCQLQLLAFLPTEREASLNSGETFHPQDNPSSPHTPLHKCAWGMEQEKLFTRLRLQAKQFCSGHMIQQS